MNRGSRGGRSFRTVLIANRGEVAVRIARACREAGLSVAAVHSEADRESPHVWLADRAMEIGPAPARDSYLDVERLLAAARTLEAQAVHPGYGFLAESAAFAEAVESAGLVWIGPPAAAIRAMGEKTTARRTMEAAGVPIVPGTLAPVADAAEAAAAADGIGYPVLLKAAAGGGGKGMRIVEDASRLPGAFRAASSEAKNAFGDPAVYVEKYLPRARHVEIQVLADGEGRAVHLGERECSLQRRHQKILEEAPAPGMAGTLREAMGEVAVRAAEAVGYVGAGTVEFLLAPDGSFFFLEMNTRLQVEHPVTEMTTGIDLVGAQLAIAAGKPLDLHAAGVRHRGHALECRISAEDPENGFLPATGRVNRYREPAGPGIRFDSGIAEGMTVTPHYDPLLAKCVAWGPTREAALARMARALDEAEIGGVPTNVSFQRALLEEPDVRDGKLHTAWLESRAAEILARIEEARAGDAPLAAVLAAWSEHVRARRTIPPPAAPAGRRAAAWRDGARWVWYR